MPEAVRGVSVIVVEQANVPDWLEAVGSVRGAHTAQIASQTTGNILEVRAHEGDHVQTGQELAVIDDAQQRASVDRATATLAAAQKDVVATESDYTLAGTTLKRYQQLYDKKSVSPQEFDQVKTRYETSAARREMAQASEAQASAALAQARTSLGYTHVRASFAGLVTAKLADAGTLASPGMALFTIEDTGNYRLEATVDESDIRLVRLGQAAQITIDSLAGAQLSGRVAEIVPAADPASRSFLVKVSLPAEARLRSGLFGRAHFSRSQRQVLLVPRSCVVERGQLTGVYVVGANQIAELRYVTLGANFGDKAEVLSGLKDGESVVGEPGDREFAGKRIATQP
jgi:RND family efflux transporter MFP subunit